MPRRSPPQTRAGLTHTGSSGGYSSATGVLTRDAEAKIYELHPGFDTNISSLLGLPADASLHFVLNNKIYEDNRIPPRGFSNATFSAFGGEPVGHHYDDGQYWDDTLYTLPAGTVRAEARLYYQSTSKEFVEFLRDENVTDTKGQELYSLWSINGKCPPTLMQEAVWVPAFALQSAKFEQGPFVIRFLSRPGVTYTNQFTDSLSGTPVWRNFQAGGTLTATGTRSQCTDDFTAATSGSPSATGMRFYRIRHNGTP